MYLHGSIGLGFESIHIFTRTHSRNYRGMVDKLLAILTKVGRFDPSSSSPVGRIRLIVGGKTHECTGTSNQAVKD